MFAIVLATSAPSGVAAPSNVTAGPGVAPTLPPSPPSPRAGARAAVASQLPTRPPSRIDPRRLPPTYSLTQDPGFTPWSAFLSLGDDRLGAWTLEGTSLGGGLRCADLRHGGCQPLAYAVIAPVWQPHGTRVGVFAGPSLTALPFGTGMALLPGFSAGIRVTPVSLAAVVRRLRR